MKRSDLIEAIIISLLPISLLIPINITGACLILYPLVYFQRIRENFRAAIFQLRFPLVFSFLGVALLSFILDWNHGVLDISYVARTIPFLVIPLILWFVKPHKRVLILSAKIYVGFISLYSLGLGLVAYHNWIKLNELHPLEYPDWKYSHLELIQHSPSTESKNQSQEFSLSVVGNSNRNSLHLDFSLDNAKYSKINRTILVKNKNNPWLLIRHFDGNDNSGAWIDLENAKVGHNPNHFKINLNKLPDDWIKVDFSNEVVSSINKERVQLSLVQENKSYQSASEGKSILIKSIVVEDLDTGTIIFPKSKQLPTISIFSGENFVNAIEHHTTYYGLMVLFAVILLLNQILYNPTIIRFLLLGFLVGILFLLSSKAIVFSILLVTLVFLFFVKRLKTKLLYGLAGLFAMGFFYLVNPFLQVRSTQFVESLMYQNNENLSTAIRLEMLRVALKIPGDKWLLGLGKQTARKELNQISGLDFNLHNQYLDTTLMSGVLGLSLLIIYIFYPLTLRLEKSVKFLVFSVVAVVSFNLLFESIFQRQWGIVGVSFFYSVLIYFNEKR